MRIRSVRPVGGYRLSLTLTNGEVVERDVGALLRGPRFEDIRSNPAVFASVRAQGGTLVWPDGADLCPDTVIWGGLPPVDAAASATVVVAAR